MSRSHILIAAFAGTSAEVLAREMKHDILLLPSHRERDALLLRQALEKKQYAYVIGMGQKPVIRNKVYIETAARDGSEIYRTAFDCLLLENILAQQGISAKISQNAGTSYCNSIYMNGLKFIKEKGLNTKMVFLHVPFEKNIDDMDHFRSAVTRAIEEVE